MTRNSTKKASLTSDPVHGSNPVWAQLMLLLATVILVQFGVVARAGVVFTNLHSFSGTNEGAFPAAGLIQDTDGNFYGTTVGGGSNYDGTVFKISADGTFTNLHSFDTIQNIFDEATDGSNPRAGLLLGSDGNYYGTSLGGVSPFGWTGYGNVFKMNSNGVLANFYSFDSVQGPPPIRVGLDGSAPYAGLLQGSDGNFYGTTYGGGTSNCGTVFQLRTNGSLTTLYSFTGGADGSGPKAGLVQGRDGNLYGTTQNGGGGLYPGGGSGYGTVFVIKTDGTMTSLYSFTGGADGAYPVAGLVLGRDGNLYGTTQYHGAQTNGVAVGSGSVFRISTYGVLTVLYVFIGSYDGANPVAGLVQGSDGNFYGTTENGGTNGFGTVFRINTNGTLTSLYSFTGGADGAYPQAGLVQGGDGSFYGTTFGGGKFNTGAVFRLTILPPQVTITTSGASVILTWPADDIDSILESTTCLTSPAVWQTNSTTPVVIGGQNTVTVPISGAQQFFRLRQ